MGRGGELGRATLGGIRGQVGKEGRVSERKRLAPLMLHASLPPAVDPASRAGESGVLDDIRHVPRISSSYVGPAQPVGHLRSGLTAADRRGAGDGVARHVAHSGERNTTQVRQPTLCSCATRGSRRRPSCLVMAGCYDCCCLMKDPAVWWSIRHEHCLAPPHLCRETVIPLSTNDGKGHGGGGGGVGKGRPGATPWRRMMSSPAVWAIVINNFSFHYAFYVIMNWLPTYFNRCGGVPGVNVRGVERQVPLGISVSPSIGPLRCPCDQCIPTPVLLPPRAVCLGYRPPASYWI